MRNRLALCPLLGLALAISSCGDATGPGGIRVFNCNAGIGYAVGEAKGGSLTTRDCRDPDGDVFADYYQFTLPATGPVSITVASLPMADDLVVTLYRKGDLFAIESELMSTKGTALVGGTLPAGTYVLVVQAATPETIMLGEALEYTITSTAAVPPPFDCPSIVPYTAGATVPGTLTAQDCLDWNGYAPTDWYQFSVSEERQLSVTVHSNAGSSALYIAVYMLDEIAIAGDQVPSGGTGTFEARLLPGTYLIMVASQDLLPGATYTLSTTLTPP